MISNEKLKVLEVWEKHPFDEFSISEIIKISKKTTKTWIFTALKLLTKHKLLHSKRKGNINLYKLNFDNPQVVQILQYLEVQNTLNFPALEIIIEIMDKIPIKNYCLLVFGSYAENKQKPDSDLDVCFLVENKIAEKKIRPYINEIKLNHKTDIDEHYIVFNDFIEMLLNKEENLGKQIFRNHRLFFNADIYYQLIKEAHKHGFRP